MTSQLPYYSDIHRTRLLSLATFGKMLLELWASVARAGPQFEQHCPKRRVGRSKDKALVCTAPNSYNLAHRTCVVGMMYVSSVSGSVTVSRFFQFMLFFIVEML